MAGEFDVSGLAFEVLEPAPVAVAVTRGPDHRLIYTNRHYRELFGDQPLGATIREVFAHLHRQKYLDLFDQVMETGEAVVVSYGAGNSSLRTPEGPERYFTFSISPMTFSDGVPGLLLFCAEVTDQVHAAQRVEALAEKRSRILRRYRTLVKASLQLIWVNTADGGIVEPIPEWERLTGQTWEEYRGQGWLQAVHPDDREAVWESWRHALRETPEMWEQTYRIRTADGSYRHFRSRAVPVWEGNRVVEWVGTTTDVEQEWWERRRQLLLERATEAMANRASLEETLAALADVIVPDLADGCGVHLVVDLEQGMAAKPVLVVERVAATARPGLPRIPRFSAQRLTMRRGGFVDAVRNAQPVLKTFPPGEPPEDLGPTGTVAWLRAAMANSMAILPVTVDGVITAVITAATCGQRTPLGQVDLDLLRQTFEQAHDLLRNVLSMQRARQFAVTMQHSLLAEPPHVPGIDIAVRYRPSPAATEVGGDWYDSFLLPSGALALAVGDVAGHDLRAAVGMGNLRNMLRAMVVDREEPPGQILGRLNVATGTLYMEDTATCVLGRVEPGRDNLEFHYAVAGHPPPLLVTADGGARYLEGSTNPMLGLPVMEDFDSAREPLPSGCTLLLYTDGLIERPGEDLGEGLERLRTGAAALACAPLDEFCDELLSSMPISEMDDIAMLALRRPR